MPTKRRKTRNNKKKTKKYKKYTRTGGAASITSNETQVINANNQPRVNAQSKKSTYSRFINAFTTDISRAKTKYGDDYLLTLLLSDDVQDTELAYKIMNQTEYRKLIISIRTHKFQVDVYNRLRRLANNLLDECGIIKDYTAPSIADRVLSIRVTKDNYEKAIMDRDRDILEFKQLFKENVE